MVRENITLAILFADIAKSTHLYETLGNKKAQSLIGNCLSLLSRITSQHKGVVIKTIGDEIMCTFPGANEAVEAAMAIQPKLAIPGVGWYASCRDTEGNIFGLMEDDPSAK